ncbi:MAG: hypothetical protein IJ233_01135, partial [Pyramidobacter sp.]|nr:hypothetical protein [Pyramidobacter sp.]
AVVQERPCAATSSFSKTIFISSLRTNCGFLQTLSIKDDKPVLKSMYPDVIAPPQKNHTLSGAGGFISASAVDLAFSKNMSLTSIRVCIRLHLRNSNTASR